MESKFIRPSEHNHFFKTKHASRLSLRQGKKAGLQLFIGIPKKPLAMAAVQNSYELRKVRTDKGNSLLLLNRRNGEYLNTNFR